MITVIGHKGCAGIEPENTLRAFERALELGVDAIEFDVRMTKDKQLIIIHDNKVDRTANGKGFVKDFTLDEIRKLDAGKGEKIPTLEEVINLLKDRNITVNIEIKEPNTLDKILEIIRKDKLVEKVLIISFWHDVLKKIKEIEPKIKTSAVIVGKPLDIISMVKNAKADKVSLNYVFIDKKVVEECHKNNIQIIAWSVDEFSDIESMIRLNVDAISSNRPDRVLSKLK
jgi:glycerophosphoryl diester phosphodiesterase